MRPRGCLRPAPPSAECRGGRCALAAGRLPSGASLFGRVSMSGAAVRYPPPFADMTGAARFPRGARPDASGGRLGRPAPAGRPSTRARGVVPLPSSRQGGTPYLVSRSSFREVLRGTGVSYFCLLVPYRPLAPNSFPKKRARTACLLLLPLRSFGTEPCINNSALSSSGFSQAPCRENCSPEQASHTDLRRRRRRLSFSTRKDKP